MEGKRFLFSFRMSYARARVFSCKRIIPWLNLPLRLSNRLVLILNSIFLLLLLCSLENYFVTIGSTCRIRNEVRHGMTVTRLDARCEVIDQRVGAGRE